MFETPEIQKLGANGKAPAAVLSIQFLRFVAAFAVVLFHSQLALSRGVHETLAYWFAIGAAGVHVFFCISGFVIMHTSYGSGTRGISTRRFLLKRFVRIFPIYWICCLLYVVFQQNWGTGYDLTTREWIGAVLLFPGNSAAIIGPGWTLSFELYFYLSFALILWLAPLAALCLLTSVFTASVLIGFIVPFDQPLRTMTDALILEFIAGAWLGYIYVRWRNRSRALGIALAASGVALFIVGSLFIDHRTAPLTLLWGAPSILLVAGFLAIEQAGPLPPFLQRASHLGDSSYVLYLIHILCISMALNFGMKWIVPMDALASVLVALVMAIIITGVAALFFARIEKPMLRWLRRNVVERYSSSRTSVQVEKAPA